MDFYSGQSLVMMDAWTSSKDILFVYMDLL
jgi:hypothetical protein